MVNANPENRAESSVAASAATPIDGGVRRDIAHMVDFVRYGDKIALSTNFSLGHLTVSSLFPPSVEAIFGAPHHFERCIFSFHQAEAQRHNKLQMYRTNNTQPMVYGDRVRLLHEYSETWIKGTRDLSDVVKSCFKLTVESKKEEVSSDTVFKIMPRRKVRQVGDKVRPDDEVLLLTENEARYLSVHLTETELMHPETTNGKVFEANSSPKPYSWFIELYDTCYADGDVQEFDGDVRIRDVVVLFHKEAEAVLTSLPSEIEYRTGEPKDLVIPVGPVEPSNIYPAPARGVFFVPAADGRLTEPTRLTPSSNALWMIEHENYTMGGNVVPYTPYLLKHVPSRRYLKVVFEGEKAYMVLTTAADKTTGMWVFHPADSRRSQGITSKAYFKLRHSSGLWLHVPRINNQPTEKAEKIPVVLSLTSVYGDALMVFSPQNNPKSIVELIRPHVNALHAFVTAFVQKEPPFPSKEMSGILDHANQALRQLILMCTISSDPSPLRRTGVPIVENQQVMLEQDVHQVVMSLLRAPFEPIGPIPLKDCVHIPGIHDMCCMAYRLLKQMVYGQPDFALKLEPFIPMMLTQIGCRFRVSDTLMEMFIDNEALSRKITVDVLEGYTAHAERNKNQIRYAKILAGVCVCKGKNVLYVQDAVTKLVLEESPQLLVPMRLEEDGSVMIQLTADVTLKSERGGPGRIGSRQKRGASLAGSPREGFRKGDWVDLDRYFKEMPHSLTGNLDATIRLLAGVSNHNALSTKLVVERFISGQLLRAVLGTQSLYKGVAEEWKAVFYEVMAALCHEPDTQTYNAGLSCHTELVPSIYKWIPQDCIEDILEQALITLEDNTALYAVARSKNHFLKSVLRMFHCMLRCNVFPSPQLSRLLTSLMAMDGSLDRESWLGHVTKNKMSAVGLTRTKSYTQAQTPPKGIWNRYTTTDQNAHMMHVKREICGVLSAIIDREEHLALHHLFKIQSERVKAAQAEGRSVNKTVKELIADASDIFDKFYSSGETWLNECKVTQLLMEYTKYSMPELVTDAIVLLVRFHNKKAELAKRAQHIIFFPENHHALQDKLMELRRMVSLYSTCATLTEAQISNSLTLLQHFTSLLVTANFGSNSLDHNTTIDAEDGTLFRMDPVRMSSSNFDDSLVTSSCQHVGSGSVSMRRTSISSGDLVRLQGYMKKENLHLLVVDLITHHNLPILVKASADLLEMFCYNNRRHQEATWKSVEKILPWLSVSKHGAFITEMYRDNYVLCTRLSLALVEKAVAAIIDDRSPWAECQNNINFLKQVVIVNGIPIARNQTIVMQTIAGQSSNMLDQLSTVTADMDEVMLYRAAEVVDLFYLCTKGINPTSEFMARGLIPVDSILLIIAESERPIPFQLQLPYISLLIETFFIADKVAVTWADSFGVQRKDAAPTQATASSKDTESTWSANDKWQQVLVRWLNILKSLDSALEQRPVGWEGIYADSMNFVCKGILPCITAYNHLCQATELYELQEYGQTWNLLKGMVEVVVSVMQRVEEVCGCQMIPQDTKEELVEFFEAMSEASYGASLIEAWDWYNNLNLQDLDAEDNDSGMDRQLQMLQDGLKREFLDVDIPVDIPKMATTIEASLLTESGIRGDENLVTQTYSQLKNRLLPDYVAVTMLQVFTAIVNGHEAGDIANYRMMQGQFAALGAVPMLSAVVDGGQDETVAAAVLFGVSLLHGGHKEVQDMWVDLFKKVDETFFEYAVSTIQHVTQIVRNWKSERAFIKSFFTGKSRQYITPEQEEIHKRILDPHYELVRVCKLMRLLQLFCEGHHLKLQNYVRFQHDNWRTFDTVTEVLLFLRELVHFDLNNDMLEVCLQGFATLTEFCQGPCPENQKALVWANICEDVNQVFSNDYENCDPEQVDILRNAATATVLSLLEACRNAILPTLMVKELSLDAVGMALQRVVQRFSPMLRDTRPQEWHPLGDAFNLFIFVYMLERWTKNAILTKLLEETPDIDSFHNMMGSIEIARDYMVEKVYFCRPNFYYMMTIEKKEMVMAKVNRDSAAAKVADFYEMSRGLITEIEFSEVVRSALDTKLSEVMGDSLFRHLLIRGITGEGRSLCDNLLVAISICLNIVMVIDERHHLWSLFFLRSFLAFWQLALLALLWIPTVIIDLPLTLHQEQNVPLPSADKVLHPAFLQPNEAIATVGELDFLNIWHVIYYPVMFLVTMLGFLVSPFFYSFTILSLIRQSQILQTVMTAITSNSRTLLLTSLMAVIVVYLFSTIGYLCFYNDFVGDDGERVCTDFLQCFVWTLSHGLRAGGGIGDELPKSTTDAPNARVAYDLLFFACVNVGLINMVFGIIIDAFAQLRDQRQFREEDQRSRCFICGIDADTFNRATKGGFDEHVWKSHNMWDYCHFIHYLKRKPEDEYTGQETYVSEMMAKNDMSFFPLGKAVDLSSEGAESKVPAPVTDQSSGGNVAERLNALEMTMNRIEARLSGGQAGGDRQMRSEDLVDQLEPWDAPKGGLSQKQSVMSFGSFGPGRQSSSPGLGYNLPVGGLF